MLNLVNMNPGLRSTTVSCYINGPRRQVYNTMMDASAVAQWKVPTGMSSRVHEFDAREGGTLRISLTYDERSQAGKTTKHTDTYHGRFIKLVPDELIVEEDEFETDDPSMQGVMTITMTLKDAGEGTEVTGLHEGLPPGVSIADNQEGWRLAFARLKALIEQKYP